SRSADLADLASFPTRRSSDLSFFYANTPVMIREPRSKRTMTGRTMAGARSLWRANGMKEEQFGKPVIAVVNSFSQFVPGHVHLRSEEHTSELQSRENLVCRLL